MALVGIKLRTSDEGLASYLSKDSTNAIKGIFIMFVFLRHICMYVSNSGYDYSNWGDGLFATIDWLLGQLIVVTFLFFSGYGVMISIKKKGFDYISSIPRHRFLSTFLNFEVAVAVFAIAAIIINRPFSLVELAYSFLGWDSIGNSNWYIFVILVCYLSTWLSFLVITRKESEGRKVMGLLINTIVIFLTGYFLYKAGKPRWWFDTIICYPLGMLFALYKDQFYGFCIRKSSYAVCVVISILLFMLSYATFNTSDTEAVFWGGWLLRLLSMIAMIVLLTMKVKVGNGFLVWMGANLFPLYIYQRLPMILLSTYFTLNPYVFVLVSFALTCAIVPVYNKIQIKI